MTERQRDKAGVIEMVDGKKRYERLGHNIKGYCIFMEKIGKISGAQRGQVTFLLLKCQSNKIICKLVIFH